MNKKGLFFTILAIALLSLFLVSYSVYSFTQNREGINKRIKTMNSFVSSLEQDIPRKLYISGYRTIFLLEENVIKKGQYVNNLDTKFDESFFNGTIDGVDYKFDDEGNPGLLYDSTFYDLQTDINEKANTLNINVSFINPKVSITQDDPWHVKINLESNLIIQDKGNLARWNRTSNFYVYIPIENFEDPIYIINTNAKISNKFIQTPYSVPISLTNLTNHAEKSYYINHTDAPSFLKRLQGNFTPNINGVESLVNVYNLSQQGIIVKDKCIIDYLYFSDNNCNIAQTYDSWIKIDSTHLNIYGI